LKRILKWTAVVVVGALALLLATGAVWEQVERPRVAAAYPAPGRLVDIGGRRIQIECRGAGSPTVVLETGLDYFGALAWSKVIGPVSKFTRVCAYSRAGIVWSDDKRGPHDGLGVAHDLHAALAAAGEKSPFVLAGLSLGGPYSSLYTGLYGDQVAGLVYVDASHPDQLKRFAAASGKNSGDGMKGAIQGAGKWVSWTGGPRLVAFLSRHSRGETVAAMPEKAREIGLAYFSTSLQPMVSEREAMPTTLAEAGAYRDLGARPVVVLTHGQLLPGMPSAQAEAFNRTWLAMQKDMATWSSRGVQRTVADAGHYIPNDDPEAVIAAIRDVVDQVRRDQPAMLEPKKTPQGGH
jgi:pimeloyl-ACP methyl ester carboxylesterase